MRKFIKYYLFTKIDIWFKKHVCILICFEVTMDNTMYFSNIVAVGAQGFRVAKFNDDMH